MKDFIWNSDFIDRLVNEMLEVFRAESSGVSSRSLKSRHDYVTNVDLALEAHIRAFINSCFPEHQVFGEESIPDKLDIKGPTWIVDPLDGTSNFVFGLPFFGCSIAYVENHKVTMGLVVDFMHNEVFSAYLGAGAYLNGELLRSDILKSDFIGVSSGFLEKASLSDNEVISPLRKLGKFRILGAQALHLCYVASGRFKACVNYETKLWDDMAGALILCEAGGVYSNQVGMSISNVSLLDSKESLFSIGAVEDSSDIIDLIKNNMYFE